MAADPLPPQRLRDQQDDRPDQQVDDRQKECSRDGDDDAAGGADILERDPWQNPGGQAKGNRVDEPQDGDAH